MVRACNREKGAFGKKGDWKVEKHCRERYGIFSCEEAYRPFQRLYAPSDRGSSVVSVWTKVADFRFWVAKASCHEPSPESEENANTTR
jgi:hypothetical protein